MNWQRKLTGCSPESHRDFQNCCLTFNQTPFTCLGQGASRTRRVQVNCTGRDEFYLNRGRERGCAGSSNQFCGNRTELSRFQRTTANDAVPNEETVLQCFGSTRHFFCWWGEVEGEDSRRQRPPNNQQQPVCQLSLLVQDLCSSKRARDNALKQSRRCCPARKRS